MANIDAGLVRGPQGPQGIKGDPFTYADFTESQIAELKRPATEAATRADKAIKDAQAAIADVKATEAKLYPAAENILKGKVKETFVHVDDAFPSTLLGIEIEGATEQVTTTGKNLFNYYKLAEIESGYYAVENDSLKVIKSNNAAWENVPVLATFDAGTYCVSTNTRIEIRSASNDSIFTILQSGQGNFILDQSTDLKLKVGFGLSSYPVIVKAQIEKGSTTTAYEPYTGGKPIPSPDYPQEIKVIENPTLNVTGRNLLKVNNTKVTARGVTLESKDGIFTLTGTATENGYSGLISDFLPLDMLIGKPVIMKVHAISGNVPTIVVLSSDYKWIRSFDGKNNVLKTSVKYVAASCVAGTTYDCEFYLSVEAYDTDVSYYPSVYQQQAFTLPAEHPYLAKLHDGTADEIRVDREGNAELVARVGKYVATGDESLHYDAVNDEFYIRATPIVTGAGYSPELPFVPTTKHTLGFATTRNGALYISVPGVVTSYDSAVAWLKSIRPSFYGHIAEPVTYHLGKIEMPKAQDIVTNVWTDAEVTPRTGIEYTRDVNIVVANLESAIASIS